MYPVMSLGPARVETRSLLILIATWLTLEVGARLAKRRGIEGDHIYNLGLTALAVGVVAGRLAHVTLFWPAYRAEPLQIVSLNPNALITWPLLLGASLTVGFYIWHYHLPPARLADAMAPAVLVGLALFSVANLLAGRAYGLPTNLPWGISLWGVNRHPTQVYELLFILAVLGWLWHRGEQGRWRAGAMAAWAAWGYGATRLLVDALRADSLLLPGGWRFAQVGGLSLMLAALAYLWRQNRTSAVIETSPPQWKNRQASEKTASQCCNWASARAIPSPPSQSPLQTPSTTVSVFTFPCRRAATLRSPANVRAGPCQSGSTRQPTMPRLCIFPRQVSKSSPGAVLRGR